MTEQTGVSQIPSSVSTSAPAPSGSSGFEGRKNLMLILAMLEKGTLDSNAEQKKYYARQEKDGVWIKDLIAEVQKGIDSNSATPYKDMEDKINNYIAQHKGVHFDSAQILTLSTLQSVTAQMKPIDDILATLVPQVASDKVDADNAQATVTSDENNISDLKHKLSGANWPWDEAKYAGELADAERKLNVGWGPLGKSDKQRLADADAKYSADFQSMTAKQSKEATIFESGVLSQKNDGEATSASAKNKVEGLENANQQIMSFASSFFMSPIQA